MTLLVWHYRLFLASSTRAYKSCFSTKNCLTYALDMDTYDLIYFQRTLKVRESGNESRDQIKGSINHLFKNFLCLMAFWHFEDLKELGKECSSQGQLIPEDNILCKNTTFICKPTNPESISPNHFFYLTFTHHARFFCSESSQDQVRGT